MKAWERYQRNEVLTSHPITAISQGLRKSIDDIKAAMEQFSLLQFREGSANLEKAEGMLYVLIIAIYPAAEADEEMSRILRIIDTCSTDVREAQSHFKVEVLEEVVKALEKIYTIFKESEQQWKKQ